MQVVCENIMKIQGCLACIDWLIFSQLTATFSLHTADHCGLIQIPPAPSSTTKKKNTMMIGRIAPRSTALRHLTRRLSTTVSDAAATSEGTMQSELAGKKTREHLLSAFSARAMAAVKYDYFAQRAELECELDAAATFRGLTDASKQQAFGFLEILEEHFDADYGHTLDNIETAAQRERALADDTYPAYAAAAAEDGLDHVDTWFQDLGDSAAKAAERLDITAAMLDPDLYEEEGEAEETETPTSK